MGIKLLIPGRPVPAVRMTQRSKFKSKQAQRYLDYKEVIGWTAKAAGALPSKNNFIVIVKFFIDPTTRDMDVDNLAKSVLDGLNKIAWEDDRQVLTLKIDKYYVKKDERAEIEICEVSA